jgi:hypothetical protein
MFTAQYRTGPTAFCVDRPFTGARRTEHDWLDFLRTKGPGEDARRPAAFTPARLLQALLGTLALLFALCVVAFAAVFAAL